MPRSKRRWTSKRTLVAEAKRRKQAAIDEGAECRLRAVEDQADDGRRLFHLLPKSSVAYSVRREASALRGAGDLQLGCQLWLTYA